MIMNIDSNNLNWKQNLLLKLPSSILNLIDKTTNEQYSNISIEEFENIIPLVKGEF